MDSRIFVQQLFMLHFPGASFHNHRSTCGSMLQCINVFLKTIPIYVKFYYKTVTDAALVIET